MKREKKDRQLRIFDNDNLVIKRSVDKETLEVSLQDDISILSKDDVRNLIEVLEKHLNSSSDHELDVVLDPPMDVGLGGHDYVHVKATCSTKRSLRWFKEHVYDYLCTVWKDESVG